MSQGDKSFNVTKFYNHARALEVGSVLCMSVNKLRVAMSRKQKRGGSVVPYLLLPISDCPFQLLRSHDS